MMPTLRLKPLAALLSAAFGIAGSGARAADLPPPGSSGQPLWEAGVAGVVGYVPDYPGSSHYRVQPLPLPYFIYRGNFLRSDQGGVRLRALRQPRVELDLSFGASLASNSNNSAIRSGLPHLDYLLEAGPNLRLILWRPEPTSRFSLELPVRSVISTDFLHFSDRGFLFAPRLSWLDRPIDDKGLRLQVTLGPDFATEKLQDYFYQVDARYVRPGRPEFNSQGGYLGTNLDITVNRPVSRHVRLYASTKLSYLGGARNEDSPLFQDKFNYGFLLGFSWSIWQSKETVARVE